MEGTYVYYYIRVYVTMSITCMYGIYKKEVREMNMKQRNLSQNIFLYEIRFSTCVHLLNDFHWKLHAASFLSSLPRIFPFNQFVRQTYVILPSNPYSSRSIVEDSVAVLFVFIRNYILITFSVIFLSRIYQSVKLRQKFRNYYSALRQNNGACLGTRMGNFQYYLVYVYFADQRLRPGICRAVSLFNSLDLCIIFVSKVNPMLNLLIIYGRKS